MAITVSTRIPLSQLSAYFDAKNSKSYSGSGTTITSLFGGTTLNTTATYADGYFTSDGTQYIKSDLPVDFSTLDAFTVVIKAKDLANTGTLFSVHGEPADGFPTAQQTFYDVVEDTVKNELLINPDFEIGSFTGWTLFSESTLSTTTVYSGSYSAYVPVGAGGPNLISSRVPCVPGEVFRLRVTCKIDGSPAHGSVAVRYYNSSGVAIGARTQLQSASLVDTDWQFLSATTTAVASSAFLSLDFGEASSGTGGWYIDSASVTKVSNDFVGTYNTSPIFANTLPHSFSFVADTTAASSSNTYNTSPIFANTLPHSFSLIADTTTSPATVSYNGAVIFANTRPHSFSHVSETTATQQTDRYTMSTNQASFGIKLLNDSIISYMIANSTEKMISVGYNRSAVDIFAAIYKTSDLYPGISTENITLYQNAQLLGNTAHTEAIDVIFPISNTYLLSSEIDKYLEGSIRSFQIYNRELSSAEITQITIGLGQN